MKNVDWKKWGLRGVFIGLLGAVGVENAELAYTIADALSSTI
ncbi:hypothetical protein [Oceanospirillum maris]|nr:hypothetical protein [Oceanospirillum maris]